MEHTTGEVVWISGYVKTIRPAHSNQTQLYQYRFRQPKRALVLGKSKRFTGKVTYYGDEWGQLEVSATHDVWMVMTIAAGNRYRVPIAVMAEQVVIEPQEEE